MNEKRMKVFWLGLFIIGALSLATWLLLFLRPSFGDGEKEIHIRFTNIERVSVGTRVTYAGKAVGEVVAINEVFEARNLPPDQHGNYYFYELVLRVDSSVKIYASDQIVFTTTGLFGEKSVAILPKAAPKGEKVKEITTQLLYAGSSNDFDQTLTQFTHVAQSFDTTLQKINHFFSENHEPMKKMIVSVTKATDEVSTFLEKANQLEIPNTIHEGFLKVSEVMQQAINDELIYKLSQGSLQFTEVGRKLSNDELYCQISTVLSELHGLIHDIQCYGLLFQYNKRWQKKMCYENNY